MSPLRDLTVSCMGLTSPRRLLFSDRGRGVFISQQWRTPRGGRASVQDLLASAPLVWWAIPLENALRQEHPELAGADQSCSSRPRWASGSLIAVWCASQGQLPGVVLGNPNTEPRLCSGERGLVDSGLLVSPSGNKETLLVHLRGSEGKRAFSARRQR